MASGIPTSRVDLDPGHLQQFDAVRAGIIVRRVRMSADGVLTGIPGPCLLLGARCISGTSPTIALYDNTAASGDKVLNATGTADTFYPVAGGALVMLDTGCYADVGGTTPVWDVYVVPA